MAKFKFESISIKGICTAVPLNAVTLNDYRNQFDAEIIDQIKIETGITALRKAIPLQTTSDLGFCAAQKIISEKNIDAKQIGAIIFLSKTPDYRSPATAIVLQGRLGLPIDCLAFDINIGGTGFTYGLQTASALLESLNTQYALFVFGDTTSKQFSEDSPFNLNFSDGAAAVLLEKTESQNETISVVSHANGDLYKSFIIPAGGFRGTLPSDGSKSLSGLNDFYKDELYIDKEVFESSISEILPNSLADYLNATNLKATDFQLLALSHHNNNIKSKLAAAIQIEDNELKSNLSTFGNVFSATIPLLLSQEFGDSNEDEKIRILAADYGEGISCGIADFTIQKNNILPLIETDECFDNGAVSHEM